MLSIFILFPELTINEAKIDDLGIRFPDFTSKNVSDIPAEDSTFLELPKQDTNEKMGITFGQIYTIVIHYLMITYK